MNEDITWWLFVLALAMSRTPSFLKAKPADKDPLLAEAEREVEEILR